MKTQRRFLLLTGALFVTLLAVSISVQAASPRRITGGYDFDMRIYTGEVVTTSGMFTVQEVNRETGEARGTYRWWVKHEGVNDMLVVDVTCVTFDDDDPTLATFSGRVTLMKNWPEWSQCMEYVKIHVRDGGTPGWAGDEIGFSVGDCPPGFTCDPCDEDCPISVTLWYPVKRGNIVIHR